MLLGNLQSLASLYFRHDQDVLELKKVIQFGGLFIRKEPLVLALDQFRDAPLSIFGGPELDDRLRRHA